MNAGFSNLATLKAHLLPASLRSGTDFDTALQAIGKGVAVAFENYCNRRFQRQAAAEQIFSADYAHFSLERYPVESISAIALKTSETEGFVAQTINDFVQTIKNSTGMVYLLDDAGPFYAQVKFTYTGGYWWRVAEPTDQDYSSDTLPTGATALPDDLKLAWLNQCEVIWKSRDNLGTTLIDDAAQSKPVTLADLKLSPDVQRILDDYRRVQLV